MPSTNIYHAPAICQHRSRYRGRGGKHKLKVMLSENIDSDEERPEINKSIAGSKYNCKEDLSGQGRPL